jgi:hypothetical protein
VSCALLAQDHPTLPTPRRRRDLDTLSGVGDQTVPDELIGCWQRAWIEFDDGTRDDSTFVIWLQLASKMADIRLRADRPDLRSRAGLSNCSLPELDALADSESSSGFTTCTPIEMGIDGIRRATAEWFTRGHGVAFQPVSAFPEPGELEWSADGTVLIERAPSGAYIEEWHLVANTSGSATLDHRIGADGVELYLAGDVAVLVRDRPIPIPRLARLPELIADCEGDRRSIEALVDCEFSFARRTGSSYVIEASTLPWREGELINVGV